MWEHMQGSSMGQKWRRKKRSEAKKSPEKSSSSSMSYLRVGGRAPVPREPDLLRARCYWWLCLYSGTAHTLGANTQRVELSTFPALHKVCSALELSGHPNLFKCVFTIMTLGAAQCSHCVGSCGVVLSTWKLFQTWVFPTAAEKTKCIYWHGCLLYSKWILISLHNVQMDQAFVSETCYLFSGLTAPSCESWSPCLD